MAAYGKVILEGDAKSTQKGVSTVYYSPRLACVEPGAIFKWIIYTHLSAGDAALPHGTITYKLPMLSLLRTLIVHVIHAQRQAYIVEFGNPKCVTLKAE